MKTETDKKLSKVLNIKNLSDSLLIEKTNGLVREEREVLTNLLHHFREIERRRLFCDYKYESLREMLVKHFGYSDDEAYRRISAMWLLKDIPEVEEKITNGELSLSHLSLAQSFFRKEAKIQKVEISKEDKLGLLTEISEQTIREAQRIMISQSSAPEELRPDKMSIISSEKIEFRFTANKSLESKISEVKGLLAHKHPNLSMGELFEVLCEISIETLKKEKTTTSKTEKTATDEFKDLAQHINKRKGQQMMVHLITSDLRRKEGRDGFVSTADPSGAISNIDLKGKQFKYS